MAPPEIERLEAQPRTAQIHFGARALARRQNRVLRIEPQSGLPRPADLAAWCNPSAAKPSRRMPAPGIRGRKIIPNASRKVAFWALSSEVERLLYTQDVGGSTPSAPTSFFDVFSSWWLG